MAIQDIIDALWEKVLEDLTGLIAIWSGAIVDIPEGWQLCDGTNGTVDLRDKFVIGAGFGYDPGDTGGALTHSHDFLITAHAHNIVSGTDIQSGENYNDLTSSIAMIGTTDSESSLPPYYSLAYIQKI